MLDLYYCETTITEQTKWIENILPVVPQIRDIELVRSLFFLEGIQIGCSVLVFNQTASCFEIGSDHFFHEAVKRDFTLPTQMLFRLGGITQKEPGQHVSEIFSIESVKNTHSTSAGRKYLGSTLTTVLPDFLSMACSCSPWPDHLHETEKIREIRKETVKKKSHSSSIPTSLNDFSVNSRTECISPVARTKSLGVGCCNISHIPST